jgi:hypothetical protein
VFASVSAETRSGQEVRAKKNIQSSSGIIDPKSTGRAGSICSRAIDCEKWPPPIYDDPDRKAGSGGSM